MLHQPDKLPEDLDEHHWLVADADHQPITQPIPQPSPQALFSSASRINNAILWLSLITVLTAIFYIAAILPPFTCHPIDKITAIANRAVRPSARRVLPRIFWIYTENQPQAEEMELQVYISHLNHTARSSGYEVRFANSWNSYDWLSNERAERITKAMQKNQIDEGVHTLLKLGLLIEHGGVLINSTDGVFLDDNLQWIEDAFGTHTSNYTCTEKQIQIFIPSAPRKSGLAVNIDLVAALPSSQLLEEAFEVCIKLITTGTFEAEEELKVMRWNPTTEVPYIQNAFQSCINAVLIKADTNHIDICQKYGFQADKSPTVLNMGFFYLTIPLKVLLNDKRYVPSDFNIRLLTRMQHDSITYFLGSLLKGNKNVSLISNTSLMYRLLSTPENRVVFFDQTARRKIQLCIIVNEDVNGQQVKQIYKQISRQTYKNWKLIFAVVPLGQDIKKTINDDRVRYINSSLNKVRNIQIAVCTVCDPKGYALLINIADRFTDDTHLAAIAEAVQPRDVVGAFLHLNHSGNFIQARSSWGKFNRARDGIVDPKLYLMRSILNHMRVFAIESFRFLPQFDLRDIYGNYYTDRMIFLMSFLQIIQHQITDGRIEYLIKKYADLWNVPRRIISVNATLNVEKLEEVDQEQLIKTRAKIGCQTLNEALENFIGRKIPFSKLIAFNNGDSYQSIQKKKGPDLIPKIIHQAWLGTNELPPAKQYFYKKTQKMYPSYQVKLWRDNNLTRENFPLTYDVIQTLLHFNKKSPYNKLATVTDILRHELLYREGGFWKDAGMNLLRPIFDKFLKYKLVIPVDKTVRYRWLQGMCFFGNAPNLENMWRITNFRNLNRMRLYDSYAISIAGPIDFRQLLIGQQEYDPNFLVMAYYTFYPGQVAEHPEKDRCTKRQEELRAEDVVVLVQNGWNLLQNCAQLYPYSFAIEHNRFGDSWAKRKSSFWS